MKQIQWFFALKSLWAVVLALLLGAAIVAVTGHNPGVAYGALIQGAVLDYWGLAATLNRLCPLLLSSLAVMLPFRAGLFNLGAEGQIYMGALGATLAALYLPQLPGVLGIALCTLTGACSGALWGAIPGWLKAVRGTNEIISSLLLNYLAINLVSYLVSGPMKEPGAPYPYSYEIPTNYHLSIILPRTDAHLGVLVAILLVLLAAFVVRRTIAGFALQVTGSNPKAGHYAGILISRYLVGAFALGGAAAGIAGAFEVLGVKYRLFHLFSSGYGFDGLVIAFLAPSNPLWLIPAAAFLAILQTGARTMQTVAGVEVTIVQVIQGLVVMFVAASMSWRWLNVGKKSISQPLPD
jgi:simple sugar transport system permease protein